jgi:S-(hydroxymethyl)glutathione dehydrogenase/alcohol dehydrogenase
VKAIVFDGTEAVVTDEVEARDPGPDEIAVRIAAAGLCHSDLSVINGTIPFPTPVVLGHEGAGVVEAVGPGVTHVKEGDHVALSTLGNCGHCRYCEKGRPTMCRSTFGRLSQPFSWRGAPAYSFANLSVFSERPTIKASQAIKIPNDVPLEAAALIGCGVLTGVGAVLNRAKVQHGDTVAVFGVGGIGLNVIQGARLADALRIVAIDTNPRKEKAAREFGATDFIDASSADTREAVKELLPEGVDWAFECVGHPAVIRTATDILGWGGTCVILGVPEASAEASYLVSSMYLDKGILGCRYGSSRPHTDIPLYVELYRAGRLKLDELITRTYPLHDVHAAVHDMEAGELNRGVLTLG